MDRLSSRQKWVLYKAYEGPQGCIAMSRLTDFYDSTQPLRGYTDGKAKAFLDRMVASGWLDHDFGFFYRISAKGMQWARDNPKPINFYRDMDKKL